MSLDLQFHEAANIFPMMTDEEANALLDDIRENGQKYAIELYEGKVLDGRNRYVQCLKLGIDCDTTDVTDVVDDPIKHVLSANLHRRHLTASQKAMIGDRARELFDKRAKDRQKLSQGRGQKGPVILPDLKADARDEAGKAVGVSGTLMDRAKTVREKGVPELAKAVEEGRMSVTNAAKLTEEDAETQKAIADEATFSGGRYRQPKAQSTGGSTGADPNHSKTELFALESARCAITQLERIPKKNPGREKAFIKVEKWIRSQRNQK